MVSLFKEMIFALFHPSFWIMIGSYNRKWDKKFKELMTHYKFVRINEFRATLGSYQLWVANYPFAAFQPYDPGYSKQVQTLTGEFYQQPMSNDVRPKRLTIKKAQKKYLQDTGTCLTEQRICPDYRRRIKQFFFKKEGIFMPTATVAALIYRKPDGKPGILGHLKETEVFLTRRKYPPFKNMFCLPGGHINKDESSDDAIAREVREETGFNFKGSFCWKNDEIYPDMNVHNIVLVYVGTAEGEFVPNDEVLETKWVPLEEAAKMALAFGHEKIILQQINHWQEFEQRMR
jgi:8-oxo-dGTP pyrophosphatase MutT (NUDIX family)